MPQGSIVVRYKFELLRTCRAEKLSLAAEKNRLSKIIEGDCPKKFKVNFLGFSNLTQL